MLPSQVAVPSKMVLGADVLFCLLARALFTSSVLTLYLSYGLRLFESLVHNGTVPKHVEGILSVLAVEAEVAVWPSSHPYDSGWRLLRWHVSTSDLITLLHSPASVCTDILRVDPCGPSHVADDTVTFAFKSQPHSVRVIN